MASRIETRLGHGLAAVAGLVYASVVGWTRSRALTAGVLDDAPWVRALEAGQRLDAGQVAGVTFGSTVGPAQQGVAAISLSGGPSTGAAVLCAISALVAVTGAVVLCRGVKGRSRLAVTLVLTLLALRADVLALPGLMLIAVSLGVAREAARPDDGWRLGALLLVAVAWAPWTCVPAAFLVAVAARWRPKLALRAGAVLAAGVLFFVGLAALAGSIDVATWFAFAPGGSGMWALVLWLFGSWVWMARKQGAARGSLVLVLLSASALSLLVGHEPYALVWPSAAGAALLAARTTVPSAVRISMALGATVLLFAEVFAPVLREAPRSFAVPEPSPLAVEDRTVAWMDGGEGCVVTLGDLGHAAVRSRVAVIPAREPNACARAVVAGTSAIGAALVPLARDYELATRLGVHAYGLRRRERPIDIVERPIDMETGVLETPVNEVLLLPLPEPLAPDALVRIAVEVVSGGAPLRATVRAGDAWIDLDEDGVALVPVRASATLARWMGGPRAGSPSVSHLELRTIGRPLTGDSVRMRVRELVELVPPSSAHETPACTGAISLRDIFTSARASVRSTEHGFTIAAGPAEIDALVTACENACLLAEIGVVGDSGSRAVRVVAERDGLSRTLVERTIGPGFRHPIEVPLEAGELALRFTFDGEGELVLRDPRIARCASLVSVINALHEGSARYVPDDVGIVIEGDQLRVPLLPPSEVPPRVEVDVNLPEGAEPCVAVELSTRGREGRAGVLVGVETRGHVYWLSRLQLEPGEQPVLLKDLAIGAFTGDATLVFSAWPLGSDGGGVGIFTRPRVHRCGERLRWAF